MGCDIHTWLEYKGGYGDQWQCYAGDVSRGRDYTMFGVLAGVRGDRQMFEPRGLPDNISWECQRGTRISVNDEFAAKEYEGYVDHKTAESWGGETYVNHEGKINAVDDPDMHSHSYLNTLEVGQALAFYMFDTGSDHPYSVEWDATLAAMRAFEERGIEARLVFCFDN